MTANASGQATSNENLAKQVEQLTEAMSRTQAQLEQSQREMEQMRRQLAALQEQVGQSTAEELNSTAAAKLAAKVEELKEQQEVTASQVATHEQSKVESDSKYPVKVSGLILLNGFVNTGRVDTPATPTIALPGSGTTGATVRQTMLGVNARGPKLFDAQSYADLYVDFDGGLPSSGYNGAGQSNGRQVRMRTAHAGLRWQHSEAFFSFDRTILNPNTPTSLTAVAVPSLSWSGNLWSWNPQVGMTQDIPLSADRRVRMQAALIAIIDPPPVYERPNSSSTTPPSPGTSELSRWPGIETRFALLGSDQNESGLRLGVGGIFAPHRAPDGTRFDTWAGAADFHVPLALRTDLTGSFYRGQALGGLGNGAYKDFVYRMDPDYPGEFEYQAVDDVGGWVQLKQQATQRLEFNLAMGIDEVRAGQLRPYAGAYSDYYLNLARNKTYTGNVIFSPSAYFQFSLEYRHLASSPVIGKTIPRDIVGVATGYRF